MANPMCQKQKQTKHTHSNLESWNSVGDSDLDSDTSRKSKSHLKKLPIEKKLDSAQGSKANTIVDLLTPSLPRFPHSPSADRFACLSRTLNSCSQKQKRPK